MNTFHKKTYGPRIGVTQIRNGEICTDHNPNAEEGLANLLWVLSGCQNEGDPNLAIGLVSEPLWLHCKLISEACK